MQLAWALADHGNALMLLGQADLGQAQIAQSIAMMERIGGKGHPQSLSPRVYLANHELALGHWAQARAIAEPTFETLLKASDWQHWTIYAALTAMQANAQLGNRDAARRLMARFDAMAKQGLDRDFPYLREAHWNGYANTLLALGETDKAADYIERLRGLLREPDPSPVLAARVECFQAQIELARGARAAARNHANACRQAIVAIASERSPLVVTPDRLLAALGEKP